MLLMFVKIKAKYQFEGTNMQPIHAIRTFDNNLRWRDTLIYIVNVLVDKNYTQITGSKQTI